MPSIRTIGKEVHTLIKQTMEEWRTEAKERFGEKTADWRFICPRCGNEQTPRDFVEKAGMKAEDAANTSYQGCIGREVKGIGCDWAAYGLFGTLGKGRIVIAPNGKEVEVFDFAPIQVK
ncbi:hypothetical protein SD70_29685 [Gordoniibacillus kamchatkensis]|uniref:Phage protein n=1 Tax=Gordoniibacillus kamchatkensis TaxID=1590651 RepID=A0ABR5AAQ0_9BACL|nr:hypothetical protein SD70_29685 [Paenibacillus sp. VKM B-2647]